MRRSRSEAARLPPTRRPPREEVESPKPPKDERRVVIPHDSINEQVLIAAAIVAPELRGRLVKMLPADSFFAKGHATAWAALRELDARGLHYDPATVKQLSGGDVDTDYLDRLVEARPVAPPNLDHHIEAFAWDRVRVEAARGPIAALLEAIQDPAAEPDRLRSIGRAVASAFSTAGALRFLRDPATVTSSARARIRQRRERFLKGDVCHPYGIEGLDFFEDGTPRLVPGMAPGQMTLIAGVSGAGKTTLNNQIVLSRANAGKRVLHGAWEQDGETNLEMLAAYSLGVSRTRLWVGDLSDEEEVAIGEEMDRLGGGERPLVRFFELPFDRARGDKKRALNDTHLDTIHEHVELSGCEIAIFDLFAKALVESKPEDEKRALDRMLGIAKETSAHLVLLHHLKKDDLSGRGDRRPTREAIKGSTAWIDAFDTVLGAHMPSAWKNVPADTFEVIVLKQRYGKWPLAVEFDYDAETGRISNGRSVQYEHANDERGGLDSFLDSPRDEKKGGRRGR